MAAAIAANSPNVGSTKEVRTTNVATLRQLTSVGVPRAETKTAPSSQPSPLSPQGPPIPQKSSTRKMVGNYIVLRRIGSGSFADVYKAHHKDDKNQLVAIKQISLQKIKDLRLDAHLQSEINILKSVKHSNIVQLYETVVRQLLDCYIAVRNGIDAVHG